MLSFRHKKIFISLCLFFVSWANLANSGPISESEQKNAIIEYSKIVPKESVNNVFFPTSFRTIDNILSSWPDVKDLQSDPSIDGVVSRTFLLSDKLLSDKPVSEDIKKMKNVTFYDNLEPKTLEQVNRSITRLTNKKIKGQLRLNSEGTTRFIASNIIYLKSEWLLNFEDVRRGMTFYYPDGSSEQVPAFSSEYAKNIKVVSDPSYTTYAIPCKQEDQQMLIMEPVKGSGITPYDLLNSEEEVLEMIKAVRREDAQCLEGKYPNHENITLTIPKFIIQSTHDLSSHVRILPSHSEVSQNGFLKVDENGIEAAAVTSTICFDGIMQSKHVEVNNPFAIVLIKGDIILAIGTVNKPIYTN